MVTSFSPGVAAAENTPPDDFQADGPQPLAFSYFWLLLFFVVYCARPEDWVPFLFALPLARIAGVFCLVSFLASIPRLSRNLPRETIYLTLLVVQLWLTVPLSPVWVGGAFYTTLDFSKVLLIVVVMGVAVTNIARLRRLIFVQAASVAAIGAVTLLKRDLVMGRLEGVVHGIYENSNQLALILVLTLPLCFAFMLRTPSWWRKAIWGAVAMLLVYDTLLTGSRAGLLALAVGGGVCVWEFGIKGRRIALTMVAAGAGLMLMLLASGTVKDRFNAMFNDQPDTQEEQAAYGSAIQRQELFWKALDVTAEHPLFGVGPGNFNTISGQWHDTHNSYTQMSSEGGLPAFILYALLLWCALTNLRKTQRLAAPESEEALFAMGLRASMYAFLVGSFFAACAYHFFPYFLIGYSTAIVAIVESQQEIKIEAPQGFHEAIYGEREYDESAAAVPAGRCAWNPEVSVLWEPTE
jgi:O-antigen ligase